MILYFRVVAIYTVESFLSFFTDCKPLSLEKVDIEWIDLKMYPARFIYGLFVCFAINPF